MFKVGDSVRCVRGYNNLLFEGHRYTVQKVFHDRYIQLGEDPDGRRWRQDRFELVEKATPATPQAKPLFQLIPCPPRPPAPTSYEEAAADPEFAPDYFHWDCNVQAYVIAVEATILHLNNRLKEALG